MSEERIDIVVTDKVADSIPTKLGQIADQADRAESYLKRLQAALSAVNATALDRLAAAMAKADSAQAKLINAQARLTSAQNQGSVAAAKEALAQQKLATEVARTEAATQKAAAATTAAEGAAMRLSAAQQRVAGASSTAANATQQSAGAAGQAGAAYNAAAGGASKFAGAQGQATTASNTAAGASQRVAAGLNTAAGAHGQYARAARTTNFVNANIIAQMQDIGVSLAGGQNPLLVFIQQGSQLSYIASTLQGGMGQLIGIMGRMLARLAPLAVAIGAVYAALKLFQDEAEKTAGLEKYIKTLGLTHAELKKLKDQHVTLGDTIKAAWQVAFEDLAAATGTTTDSIQKKFDALKGGIVGAFKWAVMNATGLVFAMAKTIGAILENIGKMFYNAGIAARNLFLIGITQLVNQTIDAINGIGSAINFVSQAAGFGEVVGKMEHMKAVVGGVGDGMMSLSKIDPAAAFNEGLTYAEGHLKRIEDRAAKLARDRLKKAADTIKEDRTPKKGPKEKVDHSAENRIKALSGVNLKLDDELARMGKLRQEREIQQRMDSIEEGLAAKKIHLNDQERASILAKVTAIEKFKLVQSEMDRINDEANGPAIKQNATVDAATKLYDQGTISVQKYAEQLRLATRTYDEATDPLFAYKEEIDSALKTSHAYGDEVDRVNYLERIRQDLAKSVKSIYQEGTSALTEEVKALVAKNDALRQQQYIQSQLGGVLNPILDAQKEISSQAAVYAELDRMRSEDKIKEAAYQQAKHALFIKYNESKLNATASFFGSLAELTKNGHGAIGAISKAAAVAEATIQGYVAVQKALASAPPPWNYIAAAAVAIKTGVQVAGIISTNVGGFATGGQFTVGGKSGVDANNINMDVTRGERVTIETPAQQRENDRKGSSVINADTKVVNYFDESSFIAAMDSDHGERVVMNIIRRKSSEVGAMVGARREL